MINITPSLNKKIKLERIYLDLMLQFLVKKNEFGLDCRSVLQGLFFCGSGGKIIAYAVDTHGLLRWVVSHNYKGKPFTHLIHIYDLECLLNRINLQSSLNSSHIDYEVVLDLDRQQLTWHGYNYNYQINMSKESLRYPHIKIQTIIDKAIRTPFDSQEQKFPILSAFDLIRLASITKSLNSLDSNGGDHQNTALHHPRLIAISHNSVCLFTFNRDDDLVCGLMPMADSEGFLSHEELNATLLWSYAGHPVKQIIKNGDMALSKVSNVSELASINSNDHQVVVDYDEKGFIDNTGKHYKYAKLLKIVKPLNIG